MSKEKLSTKSKILKLPFNLKQKYSTHTAKRNLTYFYMMIPFILVLVIFHYIPMTGILLAFKDFSFRKGIFASDWVGFYYFERFFSSPYFTRVLRNTILLNLYGLLWGFPIPIIFALILNEVRQGFFKRFVQTVTYLPYFISTVVIASMILDFFSTEGAINSLLLTLGILNEPITFFSMPEWFRTIYISTNIWQFFGWSSIIYLAAISSIEQELYEAAVCDGASRLQNIWHITLPSIKPTIMVLLILNVGRMLTVGFEKVLLLYNPGIYETADVIQTYIYRAGLLSTDFSYGAAVGVFNALANMILLLSANYLSQKLTETSLF